MSKHLSGKGPLEKKRGQFFLIGLVIALAATLSAFEWTTYSDYVRSELPLITCGWAPIEQDIISTFRKKEITRPAVQDRSNPEIVIGDDNDNTKTDRKIDDPSDLPDLEILGLLGLEEGEEVVIEDTIILIPQVTEYPEVYPQFPGGDLARVQFLGNNVDYPELPLAEGIQGTVYVEFIVSERGDLYDFKVIHGVNHYLDKEAMRALQQMPDWVPGKQGERNVPVRMRLPVKFTLID